MSIYMGYDLGDGDTSVSVYENDNGQMRIEQLPMTDQDVGEPMPTVMCVRPDGEVVIGLDATFEDCDLQDSEVKVNFKQRPSELTEEKLAEFKQNVVMFTERLFATNRYIRERFCDPAEKRFSIAIGHPTTWTEGDVSIYKSILEEAECFRNPAAFFGRDEDVKVEIQLHAESNAALMNLVNSRKGDPTYDITIDDIPSGSYAVVFDFGSSTADVTVLRNERGHIDTESGLKGDCHLGARYIDRAIYHQVLARMDQDKRDRLKDRLAMRGNQFLESRIVFYCRLAKQKYFDATEQNRERGRFHIVNPMGDVDAFPLSRLFAGAGGAVGVMTDALDEKIPELEGLSWKAACWKLMRQTKEGLDAGGQVPKIVFLTGGASRMDFIRAFAEEIFTDSRIIVDKHPSRCISHGLAYIPHKLERAEGFLKEIDELLHVKLPKHIEENITELSGKISEKVTTGVLDTAKSEVKFWRNGRYKTMDKMEKEIESSVRAKLSSSFTKDLVKDCVLSYLSNTLAPWVRTEFENVCKKYDIDPQGYYVKNPDAVPRFDSGNLVNTDKFAEQCGISAIIRTIVVAVAAILTPIVLLIVTGISIPVVTSLSIAVFTALTASVAGIPLILIIAGAAAISIAIYGVNRARADFIRNVKGYDLPQWARNLITDNKISQILDGQRWSVNYKIESKIREDHNFVSSIRDSLGGAIAERYLILARDLALRITE